jgi:transposase
MRAYSMDLRTRVLADLDAGLKTSVVARKYTVSPAWVRRLKQRRAATGEVAARTQRYKSPAWMPHTDAIREAVRQDPDATLDEYRTRFALPISRSALARALIVLGITRKKSRYGRASRTVPT